MRRALALPALVACALGCSPPARNHRPGASQPGGPVDPNQAGDRAPTTDDCPEEAKLVYLVDQNNDLLSFRPDTQTWVRIGVLACPAAGASPYSMAVDRAGVAWVLYDSGSLFKVSTKDASCEATSLKGGQDLITKFGMGFATDTSGGTAETLYVAGDDTKSTTYPPPSKLASLDLSTMGMMPKGQLSGSPELTGTGLGELWGFYPSASQPKVARIDKMTGQEAATFPQPFLGGTPQAWAFAFWGGAYWIFLQRDKDPSTNVWRFTEYDGKAVAWILDTGRHIVGAGVSTCAPTAIQ
jgi:hypothetical protein